MTSPISGHSSHFSPSSVSRPNAKPAAASNTTATETEAPATASEEALSPPVGLVGNHVNTTA